MSEINRRRFVIAMESDEYTEPALVCDWKYLSTSLEGCEAAVLALEVGEYTRSVPMYMVVRLKDAE